MNRTKIVPGARVRHRKNQQLRYGIVLGRNTIDTMNVQWPQGTGVNWTHMLELDDDIYDLIAADD